MLEINFVGTDKIKKENKIHAKRIRSVQHGCNKVKDGYSIIIEKLYSNSPMQGA